MSFSAANCIPGRVGRTWLSALFNIMPVVAWLVASPVLAADNNLQGSAKLAANPVGVNQLANVTLGLLLVLGLIFALAWLFRRYGNLTTFNRSNIQVLGGVSLGPREKAILLEVEGERLLVGVAAGHVSKLHAFPKADTPDEVDKLQGSLQETPLGSDKQDFARTLQQQGSGKQVSA